MRSRTLRIAITVLAAAFIASCGGNGSGPVTAAGPDTLILVVTDSIGVETGDSSYVFNVIERVAAAPDGSILVLDRTGCRVSLFTPSGEFVRSAGRRGSGPGEYLNPSDLVLLNDGRLLVCDIFTGGVHLLDTAMTDLGVRIPFANDPPFFPVPALDSSFVAGSYRMEMTETEIAMDYFIGRFDMAGEPAVVYTEERIPIDPEDLTTTVIETLFYYATWAVDEEGNVFVAPMRTDSYSVTGYRPGGTEFLSIDIPVERVPRSEEEIALEKAFIESKLASMGSSLPLDYNPDPWRFQVRQVLAGENGTIWVLRGTVDEPTFDVYDRTGSLLSIVRVEGAGADGGYWRFAMGGGRIAAWSDDPPDFARVFLLEPVPAGESAESR